MPQMTISFHGPLFQSGLPASAIHDAIHDTITDLVAQGEKAVKLQLYPGHGLITGYYRNSIHGELSGSLNGRVHDSNVVYGPWLEGVSSRNETSRFKGYRMFRNAFQQLQGLTQSILQKWVKKAVDKLGG